MTSSQQPKVKGHQGQRSRSNVDFHFLSLKGVNVRGQGQRSRLEVKVRGQGHQYASWHFQPDLKMWPKVKSKVQGRGSRSRSQGQIRKNYFLKIDLK